MKIEKFKVLLYLKKSGMDKNGKAPIMGRITVNRTMAQFSCKLSCTPSLWNPRASRLEGKSKEAVETNKDIEQLLLSIQKAFDVLVERERTYLFLPFVTTLVRQPHYAGGRCADGDHLQDARSQRCEDDAAVCESDPKGSASFVSLVTTLFSFICTSPQNSTKKYNQ